MERERNLNSTRNVEFGSLAGEGVFEDNDVLVSYDSSTLLAEEGSQARSADSRNEQQQHHDSGTHVVFVCEETEAKRNRLVD